MTRHVFLLAGALAFTLSGCASNEIPDPDADVAAAENSSGSYESNDLSQEELVGGDSASQLATVVYFDYDQAELRPEYTDLLARHADQLSATGSVEVRLEGHADERGSREYNIGLGERRSQAVRNVLLANGVSAGQLSTISYGEERPAMTGSDERAYAMNRRVEISIIE